MTAKQFYSEEGAELMQLEYKHRQMLNKNGYTKGVGKLMERIVKKREKLEKLYPANQ